MIPPLWRITRLAAPRQTTPRGPPPGRRDTPMKVYDAAAIRNVAIVGHGGCGKTQLVSTLLFIAGAVNRLGKGDDGSTITDFGNEESAGRHTLASSLACAELQQAKINI